MCCDCVIRRQRRESPFNTLLPTRSMVQRRAYFPVLLAQWIRRLSSEQKIQGSSPWQDSRTSFCLFIPEFCSFLPFFGFSSEIGNRLLPRLWPPLSCWRPWRIAKSKSLPLKVRFWERWLALRFSTESNERLLRGPIRSSRSSAGSQGKAFTPSDVGRKRRKRAQVSGRAGGLSRPAPRGK